MDFKTYFSAEALMTDMSAETLGPSSHRLLSKIFSHQFHPLTSLESEFCCLFHNTRWCTSIERQDVKLGWLFIDSSTQLAWMNTGNKGRECWLDYYCGCTVWWFDLIWEGWDLRVYLTESISDFSHVESDTEMLLRVSLCDFLRPGCSFRQDANMFNCRQINVKGCMSEKG